MATEKLIPYQRSLRPVLPDSLPQYLDGELQKLSVVTANIVHALQALQAQMAADKAP